MSKTDEPFEVRERIMQESKETTGRQEAQHREDEQELPRPVWGDEATMSLRRR